MANPRHAHPQLAVSLDKPSSSISGVLMKVTNIGTTPVTILTWESPLDPLALQLGLLSLTPTEAKEPLELVTMKVSRQLPPDEESLVTLDPGASKESEVLFREQVVPLDQVRGKTVAVECKGRWVCVWPAKRSDLSAETIGKLGAGDEASFSYDFQSSSIEMNVV
ncbi:hypothetical protein MMC10_005251 [Thelotrema lepadinum]|nr:hypothetical protein [Thelotrema lepadinum]